jgi:hypothetical protein
MTQATMKRRCGGCTLCCKLLPVRELAKGAGERCRHQGMGKCRVYHRPQMPPSCALWNCRWLVDPATAKLKRPDRSHYVLDLLPDLIKLTHNETGEVTEVQVFQVWVDPAFRDAWRDPALMAYAEKQAEAGIAMLVRFGSAEGLAAFAPVFDAARPQRWHFIYHGTVAKSPSGNLMLDKLGLSA